MGKPRKRHKQLALPKLDKNRQRRGGARVGAGRKPKDGVKRARRAEPHTVRPLGKSRFPRHAILRVLPAIGSLRKRHLYSALRTATIAFALRELAFYEVPSADRATNSAGPRNT